MDKLVDLKRTPKEAKKENEISYKPSPYGYGTSITLDGDQLKKLGIADLPDVGDECSIVAIGKVTSASMSASENSGEKTSLSIQITRMKVDAMPESAAKQKSEAAAESAENKPAKKPTPMYGAGLGIGNFR